MKSKYWALQLKQLQWKSSITTVLIVLVFGGLMFGTIDATQVQTPDLDTPDCEQQIRLECRTRENKPVCPSIDTSPRCPLDAVE